MLGAVGMAIDGSQLFAQQQMAQSAADAAAQAGIVTILNGSTPAIGATAGYCTAADSRSPCTYAQKNGFTTTSTGGSCSPVSGSDCIYVDPNPSPVVAVPNYSATPIELQVTVTRAVSMTLTKLIGLTSFNVTARATAAILNIPSPAPILITHPLLSGAFSMSGSSNLKICGGPQRSIQVNSSNSSSITSTGGTVDLSHAGPSDPAGTCSGTGADFGDFGGPPTYSGGYSLGSTGHYLQPADPISDPLAGVSAPMPVPSPAPAPVVLANGNPYGCTGPPTCVLYFPGLYTNNSPPGTNGINTSGQIAVFAPGIYYLSGDANTSFTTGAVGNMQMAIGMTDSATGWTGRMLVYLTGMSTGPGSCSPTITGNVAVGGAGTVNLVGSPPGPPYYGMLFFMDRNAAPQSHILGGTGQMNLNGTVYLTDSNTVMQTCNNQFQTLSFAGNVGTSSVVGNIITSVLSMTGNAGITVHLPSPSTPPFAPIRQIALVQ